MSPLLFLIEIVCFNFMIVPAFVICFAKVNIYLIKETSDEKGDSFFRVNPTNLWAKEISIKN
jgi:hypothetical protein